MAIIECVPNFSEGRNQKIIDQITEAINGVSGVQLLHRDIGFSANRTVFTFVGQPEYVVKAAFNAIKTAGALIDMRKHEGTHPRIGVTDVCPLIPISGISMAETVKWAKKLGKKVGGELNIPVYLYEEAATNPKRKNLAGIRKGEFNKLEHKLKDPNWQPDYGNKPFIQSAGASVIGARDFLLAYNVNLNTNDVLIAKKIAANIRSAGNPNAVPYLKAIGWYIEEYGLAQVSMNLTNYKITNIHIAFEEVKKETEKLGYKILGSELIGMLPLQVLREAGTFYFNKECGSLIIDKSDSELIQKAIDKLGLNMLTTFKPKERIIEYVMKKNRMRL